MAYRVSLAIPAEADAYAAFERIREAAPMHAGKWLTGLFSAIFSLDEMPVRCPVIPEAEELGYPRPTSALRQKKRCLPNHFSYPGGGAACACVACLARFPRHYHRRRCGGLIMADFIAYYRVSTGRR
jgi:hypothetical protein